MKKTENKIIKKTSGLILWVFTFSSCFYFLSPLKKAQQALKNKDCGEAKKFFKMAQTLNPDLAFVRKAAALCETLSLKEALWFYKINLKYAPSQEEKIQILEKTAKIYFYKTRDYEQALGLYFSLKELSRESLKKAEYSLSLARAYFELKKWDLALKEITQAKNLQDSGFLAFQPEFLFLKARVFLMKKDYEKAKNLFYTIQKQSPVFFKTHELALYLSLIYEIQKEFQQAQKVLRDFESSSEFLKYRIERLKKRQSDQPAFEKKAF